MIDIVEARKILGVEDAATRDEIIKRYDVILKKYKNTDVVDGVSLETANNAYNLLMGYDLSGRPEMKPSEPSSFSKLWGSILKLDPRKVDNFFHYNKYKILFSIIGIIALFSIVKSFVTKVDPDLYLNSIGQISIKNAETVEESIKKLNPNLEAPSVEEMYLGSNDQGDQAYAMSMKVTAMIAAGDMDLILVDKIKYESLAKQGAFETVDSLAGELGITLPKDEKLLIKPDDASESSVFGIDVTNSTFLKENNINGEQIIAAIRVNSKHKQAALELYKTIYATIKK